MPTNITHCLKKEYAEKWFQKLPILHGCICIFTLCFLNNHLLFFHLTLTLLEILVLVTEILYTYQVMFKSE